MDSKTCPRCTRSLPVEQFGWRNAGQTLRQSYCADCLVEARRESRERRSAASTQTEHLRNHYETSLTLCGLVTGTAAPAHYYDQPAATELPKCAQCVAIDEQACLEAVAAQRQERGPFDPNPYRQTYLAVVDRMTRSVLA